MHFNFFRRRGLLEWAWLCGVDPCPSILKLLGQVLIFVSAFAFGWKTTPVAALALRHIFLVTLVCQQKHLVAAVFQENYPRLESEWFDCLDSAIGLCHSLGQHRLHHCACGTVFGVVFFRGWVTSRWVVFSVKVFAFYRAYLMISVLILQKKWVYFWLVHGYSGRLLDNRFGVLGLQREQIDALFTSLLDLTGHQVKELVGFLGVGVQFLTHHCNVSRVYVVVRLLLFVEIETHQFEGFYRRWVGPWLSNICARATIWPVIHGQTTLTTLLLWCCLHL